MRGALYSGAVKILGSESRYVINAPSWGLLPFYLVAFAVATVSMICLFKQKL